MPETPVESQSILTTPLDRGQLFSRLLFSASINSSSLTPSGHLPICLFSQYRDVPFSRFDAQQLSLSQITLQLPCLYQTLSQLALAAAFYCSFQSHSQARSIFVPLCRFSGEESETLKMRSWSQISASSFSSMLSFGTAS